MSADTQSNPAPQGPTDAGPQIITVIGQDGHVPEVKVETEEVKPEVKTEEVKVETEGEVKVETAAGSEESAKPEERDEKGRYKVDAKTRIAQLTAARHESERQAQYWRDVAEGRIAPPAKPAPQAPAAVAPPEPPVRENFETDADYLEALTDHKVEAKLADRERQAQTARESTERATSWQSKLEAARTEIPDFDAVVDAAEVPVAAHVASLIMENDHGAKVMHHYASNTADLERLNQMSPAKAAFEIGKLTAKFESAASSKPAAEAPPPVKRVSDAPPPAARNVGSGRSTSTPLGELPMEDYIATRKAQGASWAR